jgi:hypothetical protein
MSQPPIPGAVTSNSREIVISVAPGATVCDTGRMLTLFTAALAGGA